MRERMGTQMKRMVPSSPSPSLPTTAMHLKCMHPHIRHVVFPACRWNMRERMGTQMKRMVPGTAAGQQRPAPVTGLQLVNEHTLASCSADGRVGGCCLLLYVFCVSFRWFLS